jgi:chaperonin cofactor prefoldin
VLGKRARIDLIWPGDKWYSTGSNPPQSAVRRKSDLMESPIIWSLKPSKSPCSLDRAYHMGATNLWIFELKGDAGKEAMQSRSSRRLGRKASRSIAIRGERTLRRSSSPEAAREAMASSSGSKPTTEERLAALEVNMQHLRHQLNNLDDFLQNLDIDAGRRLEMLENDITSTKFGLSEELGKLRKELKDPKQEFDERVSNLEQQMEQLNKEWKQERDHPKKGGSK